MCAQVSLYELDMSLYASLEGLHPGICKIWIPRVGISIESGDTLLIMSHVRHVWHIYLSLGIVRPSSACLWVNEVGIRVESETPVVRSRMIARGIRAWRRHLNALKIGNVLLLTPTFLTLPTYLPQAPCIFVQDPLEIFLSSSA